MSRKRENFYRRDPGLALAGMATMSLEERGVYNTILDLLYLTWRPLEDNPAYIAGHCMCAVQKLNPILNRLVEKGKLVRFIEGGQGYISNPAFDDEREAVKGPAKSRSGRRPREGATGQVEEKSAGVGEKSPGVEKNPTLLDTNIAENQSVTALEKTRQDKTEAKASFAASASPNAPGGLFEVEPLAEPEQPKPKTDPWAADQEFAALWQGATDQMRRRSVAKAKLWPIWREAKAKAGGGVALVAAMARYRAGDPDVGRTGGPGLERWLRDGVWEHWLGQAEAEAPPAAWSGPWQLRAAVVDVAGEDVARGYVDPSVWRAEDRALVVRNAFMADRLRREAGPTLDRLKVNIVVSEGVAA